MFSDRKHDRQALSYPGWSAIQGAALSPCTIEDASAGGARLMVKDPAGLPDQFKLFLSPTAKTARDCFVRWRKKDSVGVQFATPKAGAVERL